MSCEPKIFKIIKKDEIIAYGCIFNNCKCVISPKNNDSIVAVWNTKNDMFKAYLDGNTKIVFY